MKIKIPSSYGGYIEVDALYKIGGQPHRLSLKSDGKVTDTISPEWNSFKQLEIFIDVEYELLVKPSSKFNFDIPPNGEGRLGYSATWDASFKDSDLKLTQQGSQPKPWGSPKQKGDVVIKGSTATAGEDKESVRVFVDLIIEWEDKGVPIPFTGGVGASKGPGDIVKLEVVLNLKMARPKKAEPPKPEPKPMPKITRDLTSTEVYFGVDTKTGKGQDKLQPSSLRDLLGWAKKIKEIEELYQVLSNGKVDIYLEGNTSKSGSKEFNAKLAQSRIDAVERALKSQLSSNRLAIVSVPKAQSKFEEEHDYRVDINFDKGAAESAIKALQK